MPRASSAACWAADGRSRALDFRRPKHDMAADSTPHPFQTAFLRRQAMTDPDLQKKNPANPEQASEPVVSKPYIMPDDPDPASVEALAKEVADARDKTLRTLAE